MITNLGYITKLTANNTGRQPDKTFEQGACHIVALPFTLKSMYLKARQKKNYGNSQVFHHAKIKSSTNL
jgi:hypothetical protein